MKEQIEEKNLEIGDVISHSEEFVEKNKKALIIGVVAAVVVVLVILGASKWYFQPRQVEAAEMMFAAENLFDNGDFEKALNGDGTNMGFADVNKSYGCTKAGKLAGYYAGVCELRLGNYDNAIDYFKSYKGKDSFTAVQSIMQTGDAYAELGKNAEAIKYYEKAAKKDSENYLTAANALLKAGLLYLVDGNNEKAISCFNTIKEKYPQSTEYAEVDKYAAFAGDVL